MFSRGRFSIWPRILIIMLISISNRIVTIDSKHDECTTLNGKVTLFSCLQVVMIDHLEKGGERNGH